MTDSNRKSVWAKLGKVARNVLLTIEILWCLLVATSREECQYTGKKLGSERWNC